MFIQLAKADAAQRLVYGFIDETPDRAREIMDYDTAKPAFQAWSDGLFKASGGKSYGNIRGQHNPKISAGLLKSIEFDDDARRIDFCAHIVDDQEWKKVEAGVYTGFSPGGRYAKRWADGAVSGHFRYTPDVGELSIVDVPCIPSATFTMVKADGAEEAVEFVLGKAYEPGNEATKERADALAKAADGKAKDYVVQARAELIAENAAEALAKMAGPKEGDDGSDGDDGALNKSDASDSSPEADGSPAAPAHESGGVDPLDKLDAAMAKASGALVDPEAEVVPATIMAAYAASLGGALTKCDCTLPIAAPSPDSVALIGADLVKSFAAVQLIREAAEPLLEKGLYQLSDAVDTLQSMSWIAQSVTDEASWERDNSPLPQMAVDLVNGLKAFLIAMVEEEVSEMLARTQASSPDVALVIVSDDGDMMELASKITDLVKADADRMAKAGARNSRNDATRIQTIHDKACELGAGCMDASAEKAANLATDNDRLIKAVEGAAPLLERLSTEVETMRTERAADREDLAKMAAEIERLGGQPAPTKRDLAISHSKEEDTALTKTDAAPAPGSIEEIRAMPAGPERARAMEKYAFDLQHQTPA